MIEDGYLSKSELPRRGWSKKAITSLGEPDKKQSVQLGGVWRSVNFFSSERILAAEKTGNVWKRGINPATHNPEAAANIQRQKDNAANNRRLELWFRGQSEEEAKQQDSEKKEDNADDYFGDDSPTPAAAASAETDWDSIPF